MYDDDDFDLSSFVERMKKEKRIVDILQKTDDEIRRIPPLCGYRMKGAVEASKKGGPYQESLKRLYEVVLTGKFPKLTRPFERVLFSSLLDKLSSRIPPHDPAHNSLK